MKKTLLLWSLLVPLLAILPSACNQDNTDWQGKADQPEHLHRSLQRITDVIVHDIFSPPVASRIYAYSSIAAYEAMVPGNPAYQSLQGQLNGLAGVPQPDAGKDYCFPLAGAQAMLSVGKALIFSEEKISAFETELLETFRSLRIPAAVFDRSVAHGQAVAAHILAWADKDNYKQTRTFPKYTVDDNPARWKPTPPDYMDAIEPHWNKIRPFVLDSADQFIPPPPTAFDMTDKNSPFYREVMEVYGIMQVDSQEYSRKKEIAAFWDCNPYVSHHKGHVMFATKKITPGGHWMGIAKIACEQAGATTMAAAATYALTAVALADGFISCWDEKFRSELIRPETVINTYIDPEWLPVLQTPPFPEYTSGHSVISASAATALTHLYGEDFAYTDSVEVNYGLPVRQFSSFRQASEEAGISRVYGGIHYRPACERGLEQGRAVGSFILGRITLRKPEEALGGVQSN
ncbi:MAG: hypothetical protein RLY31_1087 [Bacteroidota bacterium]